MSRKLNTTSAITNPVDIDTAKAWIKVPWDAEDAIIQILLDHSFESLEGLTGRIFTSRTFELYTNEIDTDRQGYPFIEIQTSPVTAISDVLAYNEGSYGSILSSVGKDINEAYSKIWFNESVTYDDDEPLPFKITFTAGYSSAPNVAKIAILQMLAFSYANRGDVIADGNLIYPKEIQSLIGQLRITPRI